MEYDQEKVNSALDGEKKCNKKEQFHPGLRKWVLSLKQEITYATKDGRDLHVQIIHPSYNAVRKEDELTNQSRNNETQKQKFPLVVFVQGSAWKEQNRFQNLANLSRYADRGYVTASVEYRPSDVAQFPAQIQDVKLAIDYLYQHADLYNIDTENIFLWGDSSGAHTVMMAVLTKGISEFTDTGCMEYPIRGVVDYYGPTDLAAMISQESDVDHNVSTSPEGMLLGNVCVSDNLPLAAKASMTTYITKERNLCPVLIMHGTKDHTVPFEQSNLLYELLKKTGHSGCLYMIDGADHGGYEFWCEEALDLVEDFMDSCIR